MFNSAIAKSNGSFKSILGEIFRHVLRVSTWVYSPTVFKGSPFPTSMRVFVFILIPDDVDFD